MNSKIILSILLVLTSILSPLRAIEVTKTTCEMTEQPLALATHQPRFGWQMQAKEQGCMQSAYAIEVSSLQNGKKTILWESGKVASTQSQLIAYAGNRLSTVIKYTWRVKVWDENDRPSPWSKESEFRLAPNATFLDAHWIGAISAQDAKIPYGRNFHETELRKPQVKVLWSTVDTLAKRSIYLRKAFNADTKIADATLYICGLGHYELTLNGTKVGDSEFAPLWSDYDKTVYYNVYNVTLQLQQGTNVAGILLGNGFYNVQGGRYRKLQVSFGTPTLFFKLVIDYTDGTKKEIRSDADWKYSLSPLTFNCIYGGEDYDARLEQKGWDSPAFDDTAWYPVVVQQAPKGELSPQLATPVKIMERYSIQTVTPLNKEQVAAASLSTKRTVSPSAMVLDMGQNLSGFPQITVRGKRGDTVTLLVAEALTDEGAANQRQTGRQHYYQYTLKGEGDETWHPRFSYYGYRYIQIEGVVLKGQKNPNKLPLLKEIKSCFVYNSAQTVSTFSSSNPIFNATHRIIGKAVRSNMQAIFTDCPHREKLGWLEQVHLNGPGLFYNYDLTSFIPKVVQDMADAQYTNGMVPTTAPQYVVFEGPGMDVFADSPEWGSSLVVVPFMYYDYYGDNRLIVAYYRNMRAYVDYLSTRADHHIVSHGLGDWYDYGEFRAGFSRNTPVPLVATAHYYMDICYMAKAAAMVGNTYDQDYYTQLAAAVKKSFNDTFFNQDTQQYGTGSQCSNALPLFLDMVDGVHRAAVLANLVKDIKAHGNRLTTGDVGNRYLFQTLARNGLNDLMYLMHNHEETPGYGFQLKFGATTLTEQWDPRQGSSWNHFMMGQIDEWFFASLAGIQHQAGTAGYQQLVIRPQAVDGLKYVKASYQTLYGIVAVDWTHNEGKFTLHVTIPVNCSANVYLPGDENPKVVTSGLYTFTN